MEPLNNGHIGKDYFVHYIERLSVFVAKCIATIFFDAPERICYTELCPIFGAAFIISSYVCSACSIYEGKTLEQKVWNQQLIKFNVHSPIVPPSSVRTW